VRIALAGKGGAGKTTLTATMARVAGRRGRPVVCIDGDSNPNLAPALGIPSGPDALPARVVSRRFDGPALRHPVDEVLDSHAAVGPDGVRLALMGQPDHAEQGCLCAAHATVAAVLADLGELPDRLALVDMEASPEHLARGTTRHVDTLVLVTEPYYRSLETARRMARLADELPIRRVAVVANKLRRPDDAEVVADFCARHDLELAGSVPWSDGVLDADAAGIPLIDHAADDPVVTATTQLLEALVDVPARWDDPAG
jgi:CO dehydrogenase maturation factor